MILALLALIDEAHAVRPAMDPKIRIHAGGSWVPGPASYGFTLGFDSRLTRMVYMDAGLHVQPMAMPDSLDIDSTVATDYLRLRHDVYMAPGLRIPHRQPDSFQWDLVLRAGVGTVWVSDLSPEAAGNITTTSVNVGGLAGADVVVQRGHWGARLAGKAWLVNPYSGNEGGTVFFWSPQGTVEAVYEF